MGGVEMKKILVVDDDKNICDIIKRILVDYDCDVAIVNNGREALELLGGYNFFEYLITDLKMPNGVSGHDVVRVAKEKGIAPNKIALISGIPRDGQKVSEEEGVKFFSKPFSLEDIVRFIK